MLDINSQYSLNRGQLQRTVQGVELNEWKREEFNFELNQQYLIFTQIWIGNVTKVQFLPSIEISRGLFMVEC